jgi:hypothetical protein
VQVRDRNGWTCLHHALSLSNPSPAAAAWIAAALALPGVAALRETAILDLAASASAGALARADAALEPFRGAEDAAKVIDTTMCSVSCLRCCITMRA